MSASQIKTGTKVNFDWVSPSSVCAKLLAVYEDQHARMEVARFSRDLESRVSDCRIESHRWDNQHPEKLSELTEAATMADAVIVAGAATGFLPERILNAIDVGLTERRVEHGAVVALVGKDETSSDQLPAWASELSAIAQRNGLGFFLTSYQLPLEPDYSLDSIRAQADGQTTVLTRILEHGRGNWE